jgi:magnesium transporter
MSNLSQQSLLLGDKIKRILATPRNGLALRRLLARLNFADLADVMDNVLSQTEAVQCFQALNIGQAAMVLSSLDDARQQACLKSLPVIMSSQILREMPADDAVDILQEMDTEQSQRILNQMPFDTDTRTLHNLLMEEPDTAAGLMSTDFIQAQADCSVGEALDLIKQASEKDFVYYCFLNDKAGKLVGVASLKQLILYPPETPVQDVATFDLKTILLGFDRELVANLFRKYYNLLAMPVVDSDNVLRGIITIDDIVEIIDEETSDDLYRTSGIVIEPVDEKHLLSGPMIHAVKARLPWLAITLVGQFFASSVIASFHNTVSAAAIAVSFMPLMSGLSGNMGSQSETIAVRGLAIGLITDGNIVAKFRREMQVALTTGLFFSACVALLSYIQYHHWELSALLAGSLLVSLCLASALGILMPYTLERFFKQDPAGVGGPMITTLVDILTFSSYLYMVSIMINKMI